MEGKLKELNLSILYFQGEHAMDKYLKGVHIAKELDLLKLTV